MHCRILNAIERRFSTLRVLFECHPSGTWTGETGDKMVENRNSAPLLFTDLINPDEILKLTPQISQFYQKKGRRRIKNENSLGNP